MRDTRKIFVQNICFKTVDESHSARVLILIGCKPIITNGPLFCRKRDILENEVGEFKY